MLNSTCRFQQTTCDLLAITITWPQFYNLWSRDCNIHSLNLRGPNGESNLWVDLNNIRVNSLLVIICITYTFLLYHKLDVYQGDMQVSYLPNLASNYRYNKNTTCLILLYRLLRTNWTCLLVEYASQLQILFASFYWYNKIYYSLKFVVSYACLLAEYASQHQTMPAPYQWYKILYLPILSNFVVSPFEDELNLFARWVCLAASDLVRFFLLI